MTTPISHDQSGFEIACSTLGFLTIRYQKTRVGLMPFSLLPSLHPYHGYCTSSLPLNAAVDHTCIISPPVIPHMRTITMTINENHKVRPSRADHAQEIPRIRAPPEAVEPSVVAPEAPALRSHLHRIVAHPRRPNHRRSEITRRHACKKMEIPTDSKTCWGLLGKAYQERTLQTLQLSGIVDPKLWNSTSFQNRFFLNGCLGF